MSEKQKRLPLRGGEEVQTDLFGPQKKKKQLWEGRCERCHKWLKAGEDVCERCSLPVT